MYDNSPAAVCATVMARNACVSICNSIVIILFLKFSYHFIGISYSFYRNMGRWWLSSTVLRHLTVASIGFVLCCFFCSYAWPCGSHQYQLFWLGHVIVLHIALHLHSFEHGPCCFCAVAASTKKKKNVIATLNFVIHIITRYPTRISSESTTTYSTRCCQT